MCRIAHTKNPHRKNFGAFDLFVTTKGGVHPDPHHLQGSINPSNLFRVERIYALYSNHTDHEVVPTDHEIVLSYTSHVYP